MKRDEERLRSGKQERSPRPDPGGAEKVRKRPATPPDEARTDPDRGTGEMGAEGMDPSSPVGPDPSPSREEEPAD